MDSIDNVVVVRFDEPSKAYQALTVLKQAGAEGRIDLRAAAVVERTPEGRLVVPEGADNTQLEGTVAGSLIGMLRSGSSPASRSWRGGSIMRGSTPPRGLGSAQRPGI